MKPADFDKCARRICEALQLASGESVLLKLDTRIFNALVPPLQKAIREAGAHISGVILAEDVATSTDGELESLRRLFNNADAFVWLPEVHQGSRPALTQALNEWLDAGRGRAVHFHWQGGSYPIGFTELPSQDFIDNMYLAALDANPAELARRHEWARKILQSGQLVRVTTPEGTDLTFEIGDRPFCSQIGDASRERMKHARTRIDRDVELPGGVLRVAPIEESANGSVCLQVWRPISTEGRNLVLRFARGHMAIQGVNADKIDREMTEAGGDARMFREFALGFNPALKVLSEAPFIGYYGYGEGVVRLSLGDNEEMGGSNRGGGVYWNFLHNATVTAGNYTLVKDGKLTEEAGT
jgi:aminopeptidase